MSLINTEYKNEGVEICEKSAVDLTLFEFENLFLVSRKGGQKWKRR